MIPAYLTPEKLNQFISSALSEDTGSGDHSTLAAVPQSAKGIARLLIKDEGIIAGIELAEHIFRFLDPALKLNLILNDGDPIKNGDVAFEVKGSVRSILTSERLVLNCMQRMSGIATKTSLFISLLRGTNTRILDTRKTTPNFRAMEKWAVAIGGGMNHRFSLSDLIMLKDNHVDACRGIEPAIKQARKYLSENNLDLKIEVETRNPDEVREALKCNPDIIMFDNMTVQVMSQAVQLVAGKCQTEASGGITESNIRQVAETGVDFISIGALTHSVRSLDMSLKLIG
ncbi:MAG: carboxylating nicotinate-nucleotide diphosphorylase [Cyclobacteriaceae bacterium]